LANLFHQLICGWIQARQAAGRPAEETVRQILRRGGPGTLETADFLTRSRAGLFSDRPVRAPLQTLRPFRGAFSQS
jgi:hypothetical protein